MNCLFCNTEQEFNTIEHIIPESLGNDDLLLEKEVCDKCQNYFGKEIEKYVLEKTPIGLWRVPLRIKTKKGKLPKINLSAIAPEKDNKRLSESHTLHDNIELIANDNGLIEIFGDNKYMQKIENGTREFKFVMTPKSIVQIGRFLGKIGLELICKENRELARNKEFDELRNYVRYGIKKDIWPIFHVLNGEISELTRIKKLRNELFEEVDCYQYSLGVFKEKYHLFYFQTGIDLWSICLSDMFPIEDITIATRNLNWRVIWYHKDQLKN